MSEPSPETATTYLVVPFLDGQGVRDREPIAVHLEVGGFTRRELAMLNRQDSLTYYAGKSRTLKAAVTMAHCAREGYSSAIGRSAHYEQISGIEELVEYGAIS